MHTPQTPEDLAISAWYESLTEETLRDLQDRHGADTPRQAWEAFTADCLPPATNATGESLAAPAPGGQGVGTLVHGEVFPTVAQRFDHAHQERRKTSLPSASALLRRRATVSLRSAFSGKPWSCTPIIRHCRVFRLCAW